MQIVGDKLIMKKGLKHHESTLEQVKSLPLLGNQLNQLNQPFLNYKNTVSTLANNKSSVFNPKKKLVFNDEK
jgi:hypothetical protein